MKKRKTLKVLLAGLLAAPMCLTLANAAPSDKNKKIFDYWTPERINSAIPRDMVKDNQGYGYIRRKDGSLIPHGHQRLTQISTPQPSPKAKPGGGDNEGPSISQIEPGNGATIGASQRFAANVTDASGVKTVSIVINFPDGSNQSFAASNSGGSVWETTLSGFTEGTGWSWQVEAKDNTKGKGNTTTSASWDFTVDTGGGGDPGGNVITNSPWTDGGLVQQTAGRLLYEMPSNNRRKRWNAYVCSGTVATDGTSGRSIIITAAHCVYDDASKAFARNVLFIPNQNDTTGTGTDSNCSNDPVGCWTPSFGVVDVNWTTRTFPDNIPWDYAYYVVSDNGAHSGTNVGSDSLDTEVGSMNVDFSNPNQGSFTHALGYSYSDDPNFMYCAEDMGTEGTDNWWLPNCGLSGGSSGGPWVQPLSNGNGPIISVNSWGYTTSPGMAGPILSGTSASCVFNAAQATSFNAVPSSDGDQGVAVNCGN
ncbi:hypothetical protein FLL45_03995 [Aliikangiella marina]|uniref:Trypsin-like serine protease n=1 Tax=Aliikangiella marina TaxID=1712262 RepID=A0A545TIR9_9GAMM|nr:hypothetical protein [Aliikangiella marina]TQV77120.1 hypothetical protein FLL45_03995 [Aliikangiella marina]